MLRFVALSALAAYASASGTYSIGAPAAIGYAAAPAALAVKTYAAPVALKTYAVAAPVAVAAPQHYHVNAAVQSNHFVKHYDVPSSGAISATTIDVPANVLPLNFVFRSASSAINVQQMHQGSAGSFKETASQDEAHVLKHTVTKPIIQEVREVISPYRRVTQTVEPVREEIQTLVAKGVQAKQLLVAQPMAIKPALMAAPAISYAAAPMAIARPAMTTFAAPAIATSYAAAPAMATYAAPAMTTSYAAAPAMATYGAGFATNFAAPAIATTGFYGAKKL